MASSKRIKICKIESPAFAKYCLLRGADYLGVHALEYVESQEKQALCQFITEWGGKTILLTKETSPTTLQKLAAYYKPWAMQLHYSITSQAFAALQQKVPCKLIPVFTNETELKTVEQLAQASPFAIYDTSFRGGTNTPHSGQHLRYLSAVLKDKILLAGGITPTKIKTDESGVGGYDVQSYCREQGQAHFAKAEQLFHLVKGAPQRQLSVSLTDLPKDTIEPPYIENSCLEYQLDYSVGNLYPSFSLDSQRIRQLLIQRDAPFTFHIFEKKASDFQRIIDQTMKYAANKIVRINVQYAPGLKMDDITTYDAMLCASLYYRDIEAYLKQYPHPHSCLSLILPSDLTAKRQWLAVHRQLLQRLMVNECWFDRKVDPMTIKEAVSYTHLTLPTILRV